MKYLTTHSGLIAAHAIDRLTPRTYHSVSLNGTRTPIVLYIVGYHSGGEAFETRADAHQVEAFLEQNDPFEEYMK